MNMATPINEAVDEARASKTSIVADFLHGMIAITPVERFISSTPVFNRLHNVKQNSTAFLTYPSMVHSRFAHSLGTMHVAGQMLVSALANASSSDRDRFLDSLADMVEKLCKKGRVIRPNEAAFTEKTESAVYRGLQDGCARSMSVFKTAPHGLDERKFVAYCVALQAVRIAALVHDLGHPPFSHITEFAVLSAAEEAKGTENHSGLRSELVQTLNLASRRNKDLHESLTLSLFYDLYALVEGHNTKGTVFRSVEDHVFSRMSMVVAGSILQNGKPEQAEIAATLTSESQMALSCLRSLEDGILDADRLDYVQRDVLFSGIRDRGFRAERLISLLKLVYVSSTVTKRGAAHPTSTGATAGPRILASIRSLRSLEEFFEWRSELYRTVLYHHHVVRTDGLFQELIRGLCVSILDSPVGSLEDNHHLSAECTTLRWLWAIHTSGSGTSRKMDVYLQWDDHWLMSVLRQRYLTLKRASGDATRTPEQSERVELKRLEEIVASKKNYISLVKRFEHYESIDLGFEASWKSLYEAWIGDPNNSSRSDTAKRLEAANAIMAPTGAMTSGDGDMVTWDPPTAHTVFDKFGELAFIPLASPEELDPKSLAEGIVERAANLFQSETGCLDVFWKNKPSKPAMQPDFMIWTDDGVELLNRQSNLVNELNMRARHSPTYFFYMLPEDGKHTSDLDAVRKQLGNCLARAIFGHFTKVES